MASSQNPDLFLNAIMTVFQIITILITLAAVFSFLNYKYLKLPTTIGVMLIALVTSLGLLGLGKMGLVGIEKTAASILEQIDFNEALLHGMLSFLLFAGALHIDLNDLSRERGVIAFLATIGVITSTFIVGTAFYAVLSLLGLDTSYTVCLLFGALISPTDPIAVIGVLKSAHVPKSLEVKVAGESLFNDGVGIVVFLILFEVATGTEGVSWSHITELLLLEAVGGALIGLVIGWLAYRMLKIIDNYQVEVLITLSLVMGGYELASSLHTSGPIAIVIAGLLIGNHGRRFAMSERTREHLDTFWELIDEILNAVLFVMIGLEVLVLSFASEYLLAGLFMIPLVLLARWMSVGVPVTVMSRWREFTHGALTVMTWGGLRGGISVALALSIPTDLPERELILAVTYMIVVFSILVQGMTIKKVVSRVVFGKNKSHVERENH